MDVVPVRHEAKKKKNVGKVGFEFVLGHTLETEVLNTIYLSKYHFAYLLTRHYMVSLTGSLVCTVWPIFFRISNGMSS